MSEERQLTAIMFTGVVGYTTLTGRDAHAARALVERGRLEIKQFVERYEGNYLEEHGGATLSAFFSAIDAADCALGIQESLSEDAELQLRIGIHLGDVVSADGYVYGDGVNVAARLEPLASPGAIVVSGTIRDAIHGHPEARARYLGNKRLKNVADTVRVYVLQDALGAYRSGSVIGGNFGDAKWLNRAAYGIAAVILGALLWLAAGRFISDDPQSMSGSGAEVATSPPQAAIIGPRTPSPETAVAVLPFKSLSADPEHEYFADGITVEILTTLAEIPDLRVAARTSSFAFEGKDVSTSEIAKALDVDYLVEGGVRRANDRVRITVQLIDAKTGFLKWSERYERKLTDIFAAQKQIGKAVARALSVQLADAPLAKQQTEDPQAYALVLKGRRALLGDGPVPERMAEAEVAFKAALNHDPGYAAAWAGLAFAHMYQTYMAIRPAPEGWEQARREALRALSLDAGNGRAHVVLGWIAVSHDDDLNAAAEHFERALAANPSDADALVQYAWTLHALGKRVPALRAAERAVKLDPLSTRVLTNAGLVYYLAGEPARAVELYRSSLMLKSHDTLVMNNLALALSYLGKHDEAIAVAKETVATSAPKLRTNYLGTLAMVYAGGGRAEEARQILEKLPKDEYFERAFVAKELGKVDQAFALLEMGLEKNQFHISEISAGVEFEELRKDPRMAELIERYGSK